MNTKHYWFIRNILDYRILVLVAFMILVPKWVDVSLVVCIWIYNRYPKLEETDYPEGGGMPL